MNRPSRRVVLRGAGVLVALPWLEALWPARASAAQGPLRFIGIFHPNGRNADRWTPATEGAGWELTPTLAPLANVKSAVRVLTGLRLTPRGVDSQSHEGGQRAFLTAATTLKAGTTDSLDQVIATATASQVRYPSLQLGIELNGYYEPYVDLNGDGFIDSPTNEFDDTRDTCDGDGCRLAVSKGSTLPNYYNPRLVFERIFGAGASMDPGAAQAAARRLAYRKSVLDSCSADAKKLQAALGTEDRVRLDEYLTGVRQIETQIDRSSAAPAAGCSSGAKPVGVPMLPEQRAKLMADLLVKAVQCDATRSMTLMLGRGVSPMKFTVGGVTYSHHGDASHWGSDPVKKAAKDSIDAWLVGRLAYLLEQLQAATEGGAPLLDRTVVFYNSDISDPNLHDADAMPVLLCGGGSALGPGKHLRTGLDGHTVGDLFLNVLQAFGIARSSFGDFGTSPVGGLS